VKKIKINLDNLIQTSYNAYNNGDSMKIKVGDLVTSDIMGDSIGIIVSQYCDMDRWVILWSDGYETMYWGKSLEVIK
jgi:hypothetical protein